MMKNSLRILKALCCLSLLAFVAPTAYSQAPRTIEVGPHFGATTYAGDLNVWRNLGQWDWKSMNQFHYDLGGLARFNYDSRWSFRVNYSYFHLRASDTITAWRPESHLNFKTTGHDLSLMVEFNFFDYYTGKNDKGFSPYIFAGLSGTMYYVQPFTGDETLDALYFNGFTDTDEDYFTADASRNGYNKALSIPFGLGLKASISEHLAATLEWRMHYTFTDYLDGVHGAYTAEDEHAVVNDYDFTDPTESFPVGYQRGNAGTNDWYGMLNLSITWKFVIPDRTACKLTDH